ncbi:hypothetical protein [Candidatus Electrothrix sp.]|uniref:hypothetical protein n=1 Tax=Candidatus Electrothrix sp. TaxID=2170559 RepID=UPI004057128D
MKEITLSPELTKEITSIYQTLQEEYDKVAGEIGLTCKGCPDNCCDSYFLHHTYSEWAYLWQGLNLLDQETREQIINRAKEYIAQSAEPLAQGKHPQLMCPLNDNGLCGLYEHRMLICRTHGTPATMTTPDKQFIRFPGCFRCQEIVEKKYGAANDAPAMNRSQILSQLASVESRLFERKRHLYPKVKKNIAEMIVQGPPTVPLPHCER